MDKYMVRLLGSRVNMRMRANPVAVVVALALWIAAVPVGHAAGELVLAKLGPAIPNVPAVEIRASTDITPSPLAGKPHATWILQPGEALVRASRPGDRLIEFYTGSERSPTLLCRVWVRYYAHKAGWVPAFQLIDEPAVASTPHGWKPLMPQGTPLLIAQTGGTLPNAEGFKPALEFGLAAGSMSIDAWRVR